MIHPAIPHGFSCYPRVVEASIEGQSTFGMEGTAGNGEKKKKGKKVEKLQIVEAASALR